MNKTDTLPWQAEIDADERIARYREDLADVDDPAQVEALERLIARRELHHLDQWSSAHPTPPSEREVEDWRRLFIACSLYPHAGTPAERQAIAERFSPRTFTHAAGPVLGWAHEAEAARRWLVGHGLEVPPVPALADVVAGAA